MRGELSPHRLLPTIQEHATLLFNCAQVTTAVEHVIQLSAQIQRLCRELSEAHSEISQLKAECDEAERTAADLIVINKQQLRRQVELQEEAHQLRQWVQQLKQELADASSG